MKILKCICGLYSSCSDITQSIGQPILQLIIRLYMAEAFFRSSWLKIQDMESAIFIFEIEYNVPFLSPTFAAYLGTAGEFLLSILLAFGLFSRFSAIGLIIVVSVIQFGVGWYNANPAYFIPAHWLWMLCLGTIACYGGGKLSIDNLVFRNNKL